MKVSFSRRSLASGFARQAEPARNSLCWFRANLKVSFSRRSLAFGFAQRIEPAHNSRCRFCANLEVSFSRRSLASGFARRVEPANCFVLWCSAMRQFQHTATLSLIHLLIRRKQTFCRAYLLDLLSFYQKMEVCVKTSSGLNI